MTAIYFHGNYKKYREGTLNVTVIVVWNGLGEPNANFRRYCLRLASRIVKA